MPLQYSLSNRQKQAVTERGQILHLVIPCPRDLQGDEATLKQWAVDRIAGIELLIARVEKKRIFIEPCCNPDAGGLAGEFGTIVESWSDDRPTMETPVLEVTLRPHHPTGKVRRRQWPAKLTYDYDVRREGS